MTSKDRKIRPVTVISFLEEPDVEYYIEWETFQNREEAKPTVKNCIGIDKSKQVNPD